MQNHPSKPHPVLAAFFDFYFIFFSLCALTALTIPPMRDYLFGSGGPLKVTLFFSDIGKLSFSLFTLIIIVVYHWLLKNKVKFLSVGERAVGKIIQDGKKVWHNPYSVSRAFMFSVMVMGLILISLLWFRLWIGFSIDYFQTFNRLMVMLFTFYPMVALGKGKVWPIVSTSVLFVLILIIKFYLNAPIPLSQIEMTSGLIIISLIYLSVSLGYLGIFLYYRRKTVVGGS